MLPFLDKKKRSVAGLIIQRRTPDEDKVDEAPSGDEELEAIAHDVISAIDSKDFRGLASALRAAFEILDAEPHVEGPHLEEGQE